MTRICPKCGSQRVHRSQRRGAAEHLLSFSGLRSRRCHECNTRFLTLGGSTLFRSDLDRLLRKATVVALAAIALVAVVTIVVWLSRREAATAAANGVELYRPGGGRPIVWQEANVLYRSRQWRSFMAASRGGGHGNAFLSAQGIDVLPAAVRPAGDGPGRPGAIEKRRRMSRAPGYRAMETPV